MKRNENKGREERSSVTMDDMLLADRIRGADDGHRIEGDPVEIERHSGHGP